MTILKIIHVKLLVFVCTVLHIFISAQGIKEFFVNESLGNKFANISTYLKLHKETNNRNEKLFVYVSCLGNDKIVNFSISKNLYNNSILEAKYYVYENVTYIFSKEDRELLKDFLNFSIIDKNIIPNSSIDTSFSNKNKSDSDLGELLFRKSNEGYYLSYVYLPFSEDYLMIEYNLQKNPPALRGAIH